MVVLIFIPLWNVNIIIRKIDRDQLHDLVVKNFTVMNTFSDVNKAISPPPIILKSCYPLFFCT